MSCRHMRRRARHKQLKADAVVLLDRIVARTADTDAISDDMRLAIAEMRMRLAPPVGVKAPIVRTDYNRGKF